MGASTEAQGLTPTPRRPFAWHSFDITSELPEGWADEVISVAREYGKARELRPTSVTSREHSTDVRLTVMTVGGEALKEHLPWLDRLYRTRFLELGQSIVPEELSVAEDQRYAINLNIQIGSGLRYECHVDSNPLEGLLYVTTHPPGSGGELVVSNLGDVSGVDLVRANAARVYPVSGHLLFFDARHHCHYVEPLHDGSGIRVAVAMNFYTASCSETDRPGDLNRHLGLE